MMRWPTAVRPSAMHTCPHVLVVDDQITHLQALCDVLSQHGFSVSGCATGEAALAHLRDGGVDVLLTDLVMPQIDGLALLEAAIRLDPLIACVIMTGAGTVDSAVRAMKGGASDYIVKPFKAAALLPILHRAAEARQLRQQNQALEAALRERVAQLASLNVSLEAARQEAERANQAKTVFLSSMSHELRTPLNSILGFAQILASSKFRKFDNDHQRFAANIVQAGRHLLALVNEVLDLAKIESGKIALQLDRVELAPLLQQACEVVAPLAQARKVTLAVPAVTIPALCADPVRLRQILVNLLSNAVKYNRAGGTVQVRCSAIEGYASIAVSDTGLGLSADQQAALFKPFDRAGREHSDIEGTGLGLVITQRLVEAMRGRITVESELGTGSTFCVELPLATLAPPPAASLAGG